MWIKLTTKRLNDSTIQRLNDSTTQQLKLFTKEMRLTNCTLLTNGEKLENKSIIIKDGVISEIIDGRIKDAKDLEGAYVVPGFIDLQLNGAAGTVLKFDLCEQALLKTYKTHLKYGTTSWLPTIVSSDHSTIVDSIEFLKSYNGQHGIVGMHLESSFFNPIKRGAHELKYIRKPSNSELKDLINHGADFIKFMTIAPEVFEDKQISMLVEAGIKLSAGHSNATYQQAVHSYKLGVSKNTHLYNAMSPFTSREPGLVGAALNSPEVYAGIIADGIHCDFASVELAYKLKKDKLILVSDSSFLDHPENEFEIYGMKIIKKNGHYISDQGVLAGADVALYHCIKNMIKHIGLKAEGAVQLATASPSEYIENNRIGKLDKAAQADLVILDLEFNILEVIKKGERID